MPEWAVSVITAMGNGSGTAWAILVSATLAFIAVFVAGHLARKTQRLALTFQNQSNLLWDEDYQKYRKIFIKYRDGGKAELLKLATEDAQGLEEASAVRTILNDYELVAIGIRKKILDEPFLFAFSRKTFIDDYEKMKDFIDEIRRVKHNDAIFDEFQTLACKWRDKPPNDRTPWWRFGRKKT